jgi:hypothetical protein
MLKRLLLTTALIAPVPAFADTVTVGYQDLNLGTQIFGLGSVASAVTATGPILQLLPTTLNQPLFLGSGWGFDQILAMVIPQTGNMFSGGLGGPNYTFEFAFNNAFAPPQGGTIRLFATWQGANTTSNNITLPFVTATDEMPAGNNNITVASSVYVCDESVLFCFDPTRFAGQAVFHDQLASSNMTLTSIAPGQPFSITEVFDFAQNRSLLPPGAPQGDVGAFMETTPVGHQMSQVPAPIIGSGIPGLVAALIGWFGWRRRRVAA